MPPGPARTRRWRRRAAARVWSAVLCSPVPLRRTGRRGCDDPTTCQTNGLRGRRRCAPRRPRCPRGTGRPVAARRLRGRTADAGHRHDPRRARDRGPSAARRRGGRCSCLHGRPPNGTDHRRAVGRLRIPAPPVIPGVALAAAERRPAAVALVAAVLPTGPAVRGCRSACRPRPSRPGSHRGRPRRRDRRGADRRRTDRRCRGRLVGRPRRPAPPRQPLPSRRGWSSLLRLLPRSSLAGAGRPASHRCGRPARRRRRGHPDGRPAPAAAPVVAPGALSRQPLPSRRGRSSRQPLPLLPPRSGPTGVATPAAAAAVVTPRGALAPATATAVGPLSREPLPPRSSRQPPRPVPPHATRCGRHAEVHPRASCCRRGRGRCPANRCHRASAARPYRCRASRHGRRAEGRLRASYRRCDRDRCRASRRGRRAGVRLRASRCPRVGGRRSARCCCRCCCRCRGRRGGADRRARCHQRVRRGGGGRRANRCLHVADHRRLRGPRRSPSRFHVPRVAIAAAVVAAAPPRAAAVVGAAGRSIAAVRPRSATRVVVAIAPRRPLRTPAALRTAAGPRPAAPAPGIATIRVAVPPDRPASITALPALVITCRRTVPIATAVIPTRVFATGPIRHTHYTRIQTPGRCLRAPDNGPPPADTKMGERQKPLPHCFGFDVGGVLLSHTLSSAVPSALEGLASGFGMGPGVPPPPKPPTTLFKSFNPLEPATHRTVMVVVCSGSHSGCELLAFAPSGLWPGRVGCG